MIDCRWHKLGINRCQLSLLAAAVATSCSFASSWISAECHDDIDAKRKLPGKEKVAFVAALSMAYVQPQDVISLVPNLCFRHSGRLSSASYPRSLPIFDDFLAVRIPC